MSEHIQVPDYIIAGKAFKYRDYDERLAKAFNYDYESLELNREKSMSDKQHNHLRALRERKLVLHGTLGISLLLLSLLLQWLYPHIGQIPLTIRVIFVGSTIVLLTNAVIAWRRYTPELNYDLMARAIAVPKIEDLGTKDRSSFALVFGKRWWSLTYHQRDLINKYLAEPDSPTGQYFVAYYTPKTKHLLSIEPITLVQDFTEKSESDTSGQASDRPYFTGLHNIQAYIIAWWKYLRDR